MSAPRDPMSRASITPADLAEVSVRDLVDLWHSHLRVVVDHRHGIGQPAAADQLAAAALGLLATGQAIAAKATSTRWVTEDEVHAGFVVWLHDQVRLREQTGIGLDEPEAEGLHELADDARTPVVVTVAELAAELGVTQERVVEVVKGLVAKGLSTASTSSSR
jgi:MarR family